MKIFKELKSLIFRCKHDYRLFKKETTILRCSKCKEFKTGAAVDEEGRELFVLRDGSCLCATKIAQIDKNA